MMHVLLSCCRSYNDDLGGVMLSYANERLLTQAAAIHPYFPFVRVDVVADIVLFRPRPGMQLGAEPGHACFLPPSTLGDGLQRLG
jgi:hypothetical protein